MGQLMSNKICLSVSILLWLVFSSVPALSAETQSTLQSTETISTVLVLKTKPRVGLALGGGGCKCAAEIGVLRILDANKIPIDYIIGTSTGATIGAMYAAGMTVDEIERLYVNDIVQRAMIPRLAPRLIFYPFVQAERDITKKGEAGITNGAHFKALLDKTLPPKFSDLKIPFSAVTTDLVTGKTFVFSRGNLPIAVQASNCLPPMYEPLAIDDKILVDGALRANVPAKWVRDAGADIVIAVDVDPLIKEQDPKNFAVLKHVLLRVSDIGLDELDRREGQEADVLIQPDTNGIRLMTGDKRYLVEAIKNGESAATAALPKIINALQQRGIANGSSNL
jgi:NTE family protein